MIGTQLYRLSPLYCTYTDKKLPTIRAYGPVVSGDRAWGKQERGPRRCGAVPGKRRKRHFGRWASRSWATECNKLRPANGSSSTWPTSSSSSLIRRARNEQRDRTKSTPSGEQRQHPLGDRDPYQDEAGPLFGTCRTRPQSVRCLLRLACDSLNLNSYMTDC